MSERMTDGDIRALLEMTRESGTVSVNAEVLRVGLRELQDLRAYIWNTRPVYEAAKAAAVRWRRADALPLLSEEARALMEAVERADAAMKHAGPVDTQ